jgi:hypothetical protein
MELLSQKCCVRSPPSSRYYSSRLTDPRRGHRPGLLQGCAGTERKQRRRQRVAFEVPETCVIPFRVVVWWGRADSGRGIVRKLHKDLSKYYTETLGHRLPSPAANLTAIAKDGNTEETIKLAKIIVATAVLSDRKEEYIALIQGLSPSSQTEMMNILNEVYAHGTRVAGLGLMWMCEDDITGPGRGWRRQKIGVDHGY